MPKKYFDVEPMDHLMTSEKSQRKTERSHEENQERAYIAASRRADRSIEARVQSARMASEIHKRRTGKAFRISEEIVIKEEMYEEEEDDFPRSYRLLGPHMQTSSHEMNARVETYLTNRVAMSKLLSASEQDWRENAINRAFAETFPNAGRQAHDLSQRWSTPGFQIAPMHHGRQSSPIDPAFDPNFQQINYGPGNGQSERSRSLSVAPRSDLDLDSNVSPPALTPGSGSGSHPETPQSQPSSVYDGLNVAPANMMNMGLEGSAFTAELPTEAKMLLGQVDVNEPLTFDTYNMDWNTTDVPAYTYPNDPVKPDKLDVGSVDSGLYMSNFGQMDWDPAAQATTVDEPSWDTFIDDDIWTGDHQ